MMLTAALVLAAAVDVWPPFPGGLQESLGFSAEDVNVAAPLVGGSRPW